MNTPSNEFSYLCLLRLAKSGARVLGRLDKCPVTVLHCQALLGFLCLGFCLTPGWPWIYCVVKNFWTSGFCSQWDHRRVWTHLVCVVLRIKPRASGSLGKQSSSRATSPVLTPVFLEESGHCPLRDCNTVSLRVLESQPVVSYFPWCLLHSNQWGRVLFWGNMLLDAFILTAREVETSQSSLLGYLK